MRFHKTPKSALLLVFLALLSLPLAHCADKRNCDELRQELFLQKRAWAACESDFDCVLVGGNPKDCTGVLACPFAVNRANRDTAERQVLSAGDDSVMCHLCAVPTCVSGDIPVCEPSTRRCLVVTSIVDGGSGATPGTGTDSTPDTAADDGGSD
jgi:hypothetical protein